MPLRRLLVEGIVNCSDFEDVMISGEKEHHATFLREPSSKMGFVDFDGIKYQRRPLFKNNY